ncbi:MAG: ATP-dependent RNA helicase HrpA [Acidimicrobiia bacterium]|nr:ATP-dependent RNA helicase HrpA [Acidimicrobiia bacterium]
MADLDLATPDPTEPTPAPPADAAEGALAALEVRIDAIRWADRRDLRRQLGQLRRTVGAQTGEARARLTVAVEAAEARRDAHAAAAPRPTYPAELPISARRDELAETIAAHQVVIVAGETGSGKSTQLPKLCLELGRGVRGLIGHTQPRRLAARTIAERVAEELGTEVGGAVGYAVRFTDTVGENTYVKLMTDGILLAEIQRDRMLWRYDTIIVDEAHERSLNIDFLLGYLHRLLARRPDLKLIITSATIDTERFAAHFDGAPIVNVSGRTYPVEVRYRPLVADVEDEHDSVDVTTGICEAVDELCREGPGDILVFCAGERDIRDAADALAAEAKRQRRDQRSDLEVLPLYARLPAAEQHKVFEPHRARRVVLATNVAETSLTVPGVRYVVDPGLARISRYSRRTKVQRLPIEEVSQASANQRSGRCGRVAPGVCIRLYDEDDFDARPPFTEPEILRTNLASVILQMAALGLGGNGADDVAAFPFLDPPDARAIGDGIALLVELGALDPEREGTKGWLTPLGRRLARVPIDPRLARMLIEADEHHCVRDVAVVVAALSIQDPRERPPDRRDEAAASHARFHEHDSDFVALLNLWDHLGRLRAELGSNRFRRQCRAEFLNVLRVREWQDLVGQLLSVARDLDLRVNSEPADSDSIHRALLAGMLSQLGLHDRVRGDYQGARGARFTIGRGAALGRRTPAWVMAAELVETNRIWASGVAPVRPEWAEALAGHLVRRSFGEIRWDERRAEAVTSETVTLYGLPIVANRTVPLARVDPEQARELFVRHGLVEGDAHGRHRALQANRRWVRHLEDLEDRLRRRGALVDDDALFDFYAERVPEGITSGRAFDRWWTKARRDDPAALDLRAHLPDDLSRLGASAEDQPTHWRVGELSLPLTYTFDRFDPADGVTVHVPLLALNQLDGAGFDWHIPGLRPELVAELLRTLPKPLRRQLVPAPDRAAELLEVVSPADGPLTEELARRLSRQLGTAVHASDFDPDTLATHLRLHFRIEGEDGRPIGEGSDLAELQTRLSGALADALSRACAASGLERSGSTTWDFGELGGAWSTRTPSGLTVQGFPGLVDEGSSVGVRVFADHVSAHRSTWRATRRLLRLAAGPNPARQVQAALTSASKLALVHNPAADTAALVDDCIDAAADEIIAEGGGLAWDAVAFDRLGADARARLAALAVDVGRQVSQLLVRVGRIEAALADLGGPQVAEAVSDIRAQLRRLVFPGFVADAGSWRLADLDRYLTAIERRLDKLPAGHERDRANTLVLARLQRDHLDLADTVAGRVAPRELRDIAWMIEELRVSLFAQTLGTAETVSVTRIRAAMAALAERA